MKRLLFSLGFALVAVVSFNSCTKEYITNNSTRLFIYDIPASSGSSSPWTEDGDERLFHTISIPELTDYYVDYGVVTVAASFDGNQTYDILPATFEGVAYSINYTTGFVTIYAEDPIFDGVVVGFPPALKVKVTLAETN